MRKLMLLLPMVALMLGAAGPAFARDVAVTTGGNAELDAVAQEIAGETNAVGGNAATAHAEADAGDDAVAVAHVHQSQDIFVVQSNVVGNGWGWHGWVWNGWTWVWVF